jgi:hypothetical protein
MVDYAGALDHNAAQRSLSASPKIHSIEVVHHMTVGEPERAMVDPHKMAEHLAGCPHCSVVSEEPKA